MPTLIPPHQSAIVQLVLKRLESLHGIKPDQSTQTPKPITPRRPR